MSPASSRSSTPPSHQPEQIPDPNQLRHHPLVARPSRTLFDPWNSSSTGHQRAENKLSGSTGWRDSRSAKLTAQLHGGREGGRRMADRVGSGAAENLRDARAGCVRQTSVKDMLQAPTKKPGVRAGEKQKIQDSDAAGEGPTTEDPMPQAARPKGLFDGLVFYVNGSTAPLVSDHRLKYLIAENGGRVAIHLGRRQVTHVIVGKPNGPLDKDDQTGQMMRPARESVHAGGGLAAGKIQKEVRTVGGCSVRYVEVEWVLESIERRRRLPEARFPGVHTAASGQKSVYGMFSGTAKDTASTEIGGLSVNE